MGGYLELPGGADTVKLLGRPGGSHRPIRQCRSRAQGPTKGFLWMARLTPWHPAARMMSAAATPNGSQAGNCQLCDAALAAEWFAPFAALRALCTAAGVLPRRPEVPPRDDTGFVLAV